MLLPGERKHRGGEGRSAPIQQQSPPAATRRVGSWFHRIQNRPSVQFVSARIFYFDCIRLYPALIALSCWYFRAYEWAQQDSNL